MSNMAIAPGKVLVYKQKIDTGNVLYQYKLSDGTVGEIPTAVIEMMQINVNTLPVVIDAELLIKSINNSKTKITDLVAAMAQKADIDFVKKLGQTKLSVGKFIEFIKTVALTEYVDAALENKADLSSTITALQNKADKNSVYTIDEFHRVLFQFIGAKGVRTIQERNALEYGVYPFVWVLDASSDATPGVKSPAFYKWSENHWVYIGTIGNFIGGGSGGDCNCEPVDLTEINEAIRGLQSLTNNLSTSVAEQSERIGTIETSVNTHNTIIESHSTEINNLNDLTEAHSKSVNDLRDEIELVSGIVATNARDISENESNIAA